MTAGNGDDRLALDMASRKWVVNPITRVPIRVTFEGDETEHRIRHPSALMAAEMAELTGKSGRALVVGLHDAVGKLVPSATREQVEDLSLEDLLDIAQAAGNTVKFVEKVAAERLGALDPNGAGGTRSHSKATSPETGSPTSACESPEPLVGASGGP